VPVYACWVEDVGAAVIVEGRDLQQDQFRIDVPRAEMLKQVIESVLYEGVVLVVRALV
jgi:hypothetical protein